MLYICMLFYVCVVTCYSSHWHVMTHSAPSTTSSSGRSKFLYHTMTAQQFMQFSRYSAKGSLMMKLKAYICDLDFWETKSVVQFSSLLQWCCASSVEQWLRTEPVQDGEHFLQLRGWPSPLIRKFIPGSPSPRSTPPWHMRCIPWNINTAFHIHSRAGPSE